MSAIEVNFDGLPGPTHNYAGLSVGNVASQSNLGEVSYPRAAALQGLAKMRAVMELGLVQGFLPPPLRPAAAALRPFGFKGSDDEVLAAAASEDLGLFRAACSASSMWRANAATVLAAPDTADGRVHLVSANLAGMLHRSFEADETFELLRRVFPDTDRFCVHGPLPSARHFGDEGAANHMRLAASHGAPGLNIFAHGELRGGAYPERQSRRASEAVARLAGLDGDRTLYALQNEAAVQAGAFHNDVVAVANANVLLAHPEAFADPARLYGALRERLPNLHIVETFGVSLADAVSSYLFNSQLVTLPDGHMALILPSDVKDSAVAWKAVETVLAADNPISEAVVVDVRESMRNGGGPACLRLRVPVDGPARAGIDPRFLLTPERWQALSAVVEAHWPERISPDDLVDPQLWAQARAAHAALEAVIAD
ncbi:N-succinylarginine dihydrolase [Phenylobacterium sp. Root700]|uniref:N-succinylarginine dihydrolase n=1 Tax=Phenylobacterium sp. Root700 TaxID=1736591 RepID=UPI0006F27989|nr:N-succinylarginine dihydrolase [Phenylobacterium sp. Root700]KRB41257.1 succinylarginine dihydrolase [Phenylobacterium sp. Root700]